MHFCIQDVQTFEAAEGVVLSVKEEPGVAILIEELFKMGQLEDVATRASAVKLLQVLCSRSSADLLDHTPQLVVYVTECLGDPEEDVCIRAWDALSALVNRVS